MFFLFFDSTWPQLLQENGYTFVVDGTSNIFYGALSLISTDNPASSALSGLKDSGTALRYCRQCLGTSDEASTKESDPMFICIIADARDYSLLNAVTRAGFHSEKVAYTFTAM